MERISRSPSRGLASASMTTTPWLLTMKPAFGLPSDPRPVSPGTAYTLGATLRTGNGLESERSGCSAASGKAGNDGCESGEGKNIEPARMCRQRWDTGSESGSSKAYTHRLFERRAFVVGPHHGEWSFLVGLDGEGHHRIPADPGSPFEPGHFLIAIGD